MLGRIIAFWEGWGVWLLLPGLAALVAGDVAMRYFLNLPLQWGANVKSLLLLLVMTAGLGGTSLHDQHIRVVLFDERLPPRTRRLLARLRHLLTALVALAVTWALADLAADMHRYGDRAEMIAIPLAPVAALAAVAAALSALAELARALHPLPPDPARGEPPEVQA